MKLVHFSRNVVVSRTLEPIRGATHVPSNQKSNLQKFYLFSLLLSLFYFHFLGMSPVFLIVFRFFLNFFFFVLPFLLSRLYFIPNIKSAKRYGGQNNGEEATENNDCSNFERIIDALIPSFIWLSHF